MLCLKENFNCISAFISNEINKAQIQRIIKPDGFELHYSIFHPIMLMTSRQCLFHQVTGCEKSSVDDSCIKSCEKSATIKNLKNQSFLITKKMGNHHCIYNDYHFMNADIHIDIPDLFSGFMIDLRDVKTKTSFEADKSGIIKLFKNLITGESDAKEKIYKMIHHTVNEQYIKGI